MKLSKLENMGQIKNLAIGTIIPMYEEHPWIENPYEGMIIKKQENEITVFGRYLGNKNNEDEWLKLIIKQIKSDTRVEDGCFFFNSDYGTVKLIEVEGQEYDTLMKKFEEALK